MKQRLHKHDVIALSYAALTLLLGALAAGTIVTFVNKSAENAPRVCYTDYECCQQAHTCQDGISY